MTGIDLEQVDSCKASEAHSPSEEDKQIPLCCPTFVGAAAQKTQLICKKVTNKLKVLCFFLNVMLFQGVNIKQFLCSSGFYVKHINAGLIRTNSSLQSPQRLPSLCQFPGGS